VKAWRQVEGGRLVHEDFYVHDELWDAVCPDDEVREWVVDGTTFREGKFVICLGCFESRLGRRLTREDLTVRPQELFGTPASRRLASRWDNGAGERT
jgi:hypothetical protein